MAAPDKHVRIVTRVARMKLMAEQRPNHNAGAEHADSTADYKRDWRRLTDEQRAAATDAAQEIADMTPELISAAIAELET